MWGISLIISTSIAIVSVTINVLKFYQDNRSIILKWRFRNETSFKTIYDEKTLNKVGIEEDSPTAILETVIVNNSTKPISVIDIRIDPAPIKYMNKHHVFFEHFPVHPDIPAGQKFELSPYPIPIDTKFVTIIVITGRYSKRKRISVNLSKVDY